MNTIWDWVTLFTLAGLATLLLQRSTAEQETDKLWHYAPAGIGLAVVNQLGNNDQVALAVVLFVAVLVNLIVGITARSWGRARTEEWSGGLQAADGGLKPAAPPAPILAAAALVGFAFLLMELVWYRMLAPLLGGSTFTFGLILAVALLGIGLGGASYSLWSGRTRATAGGFALTCSLEAAALALPFMLGDRLAIVQNYLRTLGALGFHGYVIGWTLLTFIVVFPAAFIAGVQFPLLISLLGEGREGVGRHVGLAYAWNTAGAIAGSLAGGFGLLPILTAPGTWKLVIILLALAAVATRKVVPSAIAVATVIATFVVLGPTAVWRHSGIGAGRAAKPTSVNAIREWANGVRRALVWDADGRESSVALVATNDYAFIINGKADGSARGDAGTQVMSGMIGAILHPNPRHAMVIGLGTGSTAGWLGAVPGMERVDVVELEPAVLRVAAACSAVNQDVLHNPKVQIRIGDAREVLLASRSRYDIIFSEPSNPYRAGIASLFTEEFYRASAQRLNGDGMFLQWVQAYDVDAQTIRTIYATISSVFPFVDTWHTDTGDLLLAASKQPRVIDIDRLRARVRQQPYFSAMSNAWRIESVEGFLAHFVANESLPRAIAKGETERNTDDRTLVEFGFARGLGEQDRFNLSELAGLARARGADRPLRLTGAIDWSIVDANRASFDYIYQLPPSPSAGLLAQHRAATEFGSGALPQVAAEWRAHPFPPVNSGQLTMIAEALADAGSHAAEAYSEQLRPLRPADADAILARLRFRQARIPESAALLVRAFVTARTNPWSTNGTMQRALDLALDLGKANARAAPLLAAVEKPFTTGQMEDIRSLQRVKLAKELQGCGPRTLAALHALEPWPPWNGYMLALRRDCYQSVMDPRAGRAQKELETFVAAEPSPLLAP